MSRHHKSAPNENALLPDWTYFVEVCSFTFEFCSLEQIEEYLDYYRQKIHPSSADGAEKKFFVKTVFGGYLTSSNAGDHWERQTRFDRLPLYLREEPKRLKVVKALKRALKQWKPSRFLHHMKSLATFCPLICALILAVPTYAKPAASRLLQTHGANVTALAYAPDGKTLASADEGGRVKLTDVGSGKTKLTFRYKEEVTALAYAPDGKMLAAGRAREVRLLNPQTAAPIRVLKTQQEVSSALNFSANGQLLIVSEGDGQSGAACSVWNVNQGKQLQRHRVRYAEVQTAAISPDGKVFVAPNPEKEKFGLSLWSVETGQRIRLLINEDTEQDYPYIGTVAFSPNGKLLAGAGSFMEGPGHLTMWNVATGKVNWGRTFSDFGGAIAWSSDSARVAVGTSYDTTYDDPKHLHQPTGAPIFDAVSGNWQQSLQRTPGDIDALAFAPGGQTFAVGAAKTVRLWRVLS